MVVVILALDLVATIAIAPSAITDIMANVVGGRGNKIESTYGNHGTSM